MGLVNKIFGTYSERQIKKLEKTLHQIEALAPSYAAMTNEELSGTTDRLKARLAAGETLDDILPDAYAAIREADDRVLGKRPFYVQLIGGIILHQGRIAEMKTGEGKTLVATMPAYLNALNGKGVHIVTVNDYLARRDSEEMGRVYEFMGLKTGLVVHGLSTEQKQAAYNADITYGTNNEFGFDYLRDNMAIYKNRMMQREHVFAIVDEVDSILIDEARTPLIISGEGSESTDMYKKVDAFVRRLKKMVVKEIDNKEEQDSIDADYIVDEKANNAVLTPAGAKRAETYFGVENFNDPENITLVHHVNQAIRAHGCMHRDVDYVVNENGVMIVDAFTGRLMPGRRYSDGLHQAIEAKEGVKVEKENKTLATITFQNYFRMYDKLSGMTGTAMTEENEFREIYGLDVVEVPTNMPMIRKDWHDVVYKTVPGKYRAVVEQIKQCHAKGQPVLVGTISIDKSEELSKLLKREGIPHTVLNAKYHAKEAEIVAQAGKLGAVTISTNMAGRGTDIMLGGNPEYMAKAEMRRMEIDEDLIAMATGTREIDDENVQNARQIYAGLYRKYKEEIAPEAEKVKEAGGLFILGTERHESRRIDNQLRGRSGRQGDPGTSKFFLSMEDDLMRIFGSERMSSVLQKLGLPEGEPLVHPWISKALEKAQQKVEERNFDIRKNLLKYDNVMNEQRKVIYAQRKEMMESDDLSEIVMDMRQELLSEIVDAHIPAGTAPEHWDIDGLHQDILRVTGFDLPIAQWAKEKDVNEDDIRENVINSVEEHLKEKNAGIPENILRMVEKSILMQVLDQLWKDHIATLDLMRHTIVLRAYGQKDPLNEYKKEAFKMFADMLDALKEQTTVVICRTQIKQESAEHLQQREQKVQNQNMNAIHEEASSVVQQRPAAAVENQARFRPQAKEFNPDDPSTWGKVARNEPCPCGSGKKFKHCHGRY